jgi:Uma2 family endonuclease
MAPPQRRPFTRAEYERAAELGLFGPEERLELIGGEVIKKVTPQRSLHATGVSLAADVLKRAFPGGHDVRVQLPLVIGDDSEPEPDVALVRGEIRDHLAAHPSTALLVIEVADSSLAFDRTTKASLYASAGIPEYWVVNLQDRVLEVHRAPESMAGQPFGHLYRSITRYAEDGSIAPLAAPGSVVRVADLIP